ncbi:BolA family protein [Pacificimonas flava]|uniref:Cell division protein BolA n=1 Tax=Pacificimonas flava TaxID=1234595 RepID=M2SF36_9SPHN|nr:BolA family protein [Pacificimonas flava]EMD83965.1 Cell division protein BolA [Pacificimonas flava]MBB5281062.1 BolA protein [Pacificimonas flava]
MQTMETEIRERLTRALAPTRLEVVNESALHAGHAGDDGTGESHFAVEIESAALAGQSRVARQRAVYAALGDLMQRIHALRIKAEG